MDKTERKFVDYTAALDYADLSAGAIHAVKRSVIDSIGCAYGAFHMDPLKAVRQVAAQVTAKSPATVLGTAIGTSPEMAAIANGAMIRYLDYSDDYFGGAGEVGPHPSDNISGVLAAAESAGTDGKAFILGTVVAYEACGQIVDRVNLRGKKRTWDYPILHSIGTVLGAGKVLGLTPHQLRDALALAIVPNICLGQTRHGELSNWKGFAGPNGSRNGLFAAYLAQAGVSGPEDPFEGKTGLMNFLGQPFDSFEAGEFGGGNIPFKIERTFFKYMPVKYAVQLPVWMAFELRKTIDVRQIKSMAIQMGRRYFLPKSEHPAFWNPTTRETVDHSFPYLTGAALIDGEITDATFTPARFRDPAILALIQKIDMEEDKAFSAAFPHALKCRFVVTLNSGEVVMLEQSNPKGHVDNPMSDGEVEEKFLKQATDAGLPPASSRRLLDRLWELEKVTDLKTVLALMRLPTA
jgi:2-methylcitrate dehydratase